jgi:hypothetical protein
LGHSNRKRIKTPQDGHMECARCLEVKPVADFNIDSTRTSGLDPYCRVCQRAAYKKRKPESKYRKWSSSRARHQAYAAARRALKKAQFVEHVDPQVVYERDKGICGICQGPVDPQNFHVDHVCPLAKGGEHSYANTQVAHPACNCAKRDRLDYEHA